MGYKISYITCKLRLYFVENKTKLKSTLFPRFKLPQNPLKGTFHISDFGFLTSDF